MWGNNIVCRKMKLDQTSNDAKCIGKTVFLKGLKGERGEKGENGETGKKGTKGIKGDVNFIGLFHV